MVINNLDGCCAVDEIQDLADHETPESAMRELCRELWGGPYGRVHTKPQAFYVFTGVLRHTRLADFADLPCPREGKYGPNFKKFILANKLGKVVQTVTRNNRRNHENHFLKVYVWAPDEDKLRAWWAANK
jgi:hypothetical protein